MRPRTAIAAEPQCCPNSDNYACAEAPPLAATASASGRSTANRSTSSNGGDWLSTSWVADEGWVMAVPGDRKFRWSMEAKRGRTQFPQTHLACRVIGKSYADPPAPGSERCHPSLE